MKKTLQTVVIFAALSAATSAATIHGTYTNSVSDKGPESNFSLIGDDFNASFYLRAQTGPAVYCNYGPTCSYSSSGGMAAYPSQGVVFDVTSNGIKYDGRSGRMSIWMDFKGATSTAPVTGSNTYFEANWPVASITMVGAWSIKDWDNAIIATGSLSGAGEASARFYQNFPWGNTSGSMQGSITYRLLSAPVAASDVCGTAPEPVSMALAGAGLLLLAIVRKVRL